MNAGDLITAAWDAKGPSKEVTTKLAKLDQKELEELINKLHGERANVRKAMLLVQKVLSDKIVAAEALRKIESASSEERAAMLQYLQRKAFPRRRKSERLVTKGVSPMPDEKVGVKAKATFMLRKIDDATKKVVETIEGGDDKPMIVTKYDENGNVVNQVVNPVTFVDQMEPKK